MATNLLTGRFQSGNNAGMTHPLKTFRDTHEPKLSQAELAERIGVDRTTVYRWETGDRMPDVELLTRITEKTGIPARELRPDLIGLADRLAADQ